MDWSVVVRSLWSAAAPVTFVSRPPCEPVPVILRIALIAVVRLSESGEVSGIAENATLPSLEMSPGGAATPTGASTRATPLSLPICWASAAIFALSAALSPPARL